MQRAPGCDMALVHDDDLVPVLGVDDVNVSEGLSASSSIDSSIFTVPGDPSTRCGNGIPPKVKI